MPISNTRDTVKPPLKASVPRNIFTVQVQYYAEIRILFVTTKSLQFGKNMYFSNKNKFSIFYFGICVVV